MLGQHEDMTRQNIMKAILQTAGPVSTHQTVKQNWRFLRMLSVKQFLSACNDLQALNMGTLVSLQQGKRKIFVKRPPDEVQEMLDMNPFLSTLEVYEYRFNRPSPKCISLEVQAALVSMGYVVEAHFRNPTR